MTLPGGTVHDQGEGYSSNGEITQTAANHVDLAPMLPDGVAHRRRGQAGALVGDPTEGALVVFAAKGGIDVDGHPSAFPLSPRYPSTPPIS